MGEAETVYLDYGDAPLMIDNAPFDVGIRGAAHALFDYTRRAKHDALFGT